MCIRDRPSAIVLWTSSEFLQLVLLPIIIVGQNIQAKASDARAEDTYKDAEAIMHECVQLQIHLRAQDEVMMESIDHLRGLAAVSYTHLDVYKRQRRASSPGPRRSAATSRLRCTAAARYT